VNDREFLQPGYVVEALTFRNPFVSQS